MRLVSETWPDGLWAVRERVQVVDDATGVLMLLAVNPANAERVVYHHNRLLLAGEIGSQKR